MIPSTTNRLLASLSDEARTQILSQSVTLPAPIRMNFYDADEVPEFAHFVLSGMASIVATTEDGSTAEVGVVGLEGFIGSVHLLGPARVSTTSYMQIEGTVLRVPYAELRKLFRNSDEIRNRILEFVQEQALVVSQIAGCNRLHEAEARLARWLLMARDLTGSGTLNLTQEFLSMMLGARRTTVSLVASALQRHGAIRYVRGSVEILDSPRLEELACDCYRITKRLHSDLYRTM